MPNAHAMIREPTGRIKFWARGLEELYGFTSAQAVGRISHKLLNTEFPISLKDINDELFDTGQWNGELAHRKCDGKTVVVASHWALWRDREEQTLHNRSQQRDPQTRRFVPNLCARRWLGCARSEHLLQPQDPADGAQKITNLYGARQARPRSRRPPFAAGLFLRWLA